MLNLMTLLALGFASYRATQLVVHDTIADPIRDRIELWHANRFESRFRGFVRDLFSCIYCIGFWLAVATTAVYLTATGTWGDAPLAVHGIEAWAVAGVQALLNRWDDTRSGD